MLRRRALESPRTRALRRKKAIRFAIAAGAALVSMACAVLLLFNSRYTRIASVSISGAPAPLAGRIQGAVEGTLQGAHLGLIPRDSGFFFPARTLGRSLVAEFPELASVAFDRQGLSGVAIAVVLRQPAEVVCVNASDCYYADASGVIFESAPKDAGSFLVYHIALPPKAQPIGLDFLDAGRLRSVGDFTAGLARIGFAAGAVTVMGGGEYRFDIRNLGSLSEALPTQLFVSEEKPFAETLQDFSAFWSQHLAAVAAGAEKRTLSSVDMRYGDTVVYKAR